MLKDIPGACPTSQAVFYQRVSEHKEKTGRVRPDRLKPSYDFPGVRISVPLFLFRSQILVWQEGNKYCSLENIHAMLCMYYFICKEKWHMGQSPNFKSKPVVQSTVASLFW